MPLDHDAFATTNLPFDQVDAPGPYTLPGDESVQSEPEEEPRPQARSHRPRRRGIQTFLSAGLSVVLLVSFGITTAVSGDARALLAADTFDGAGSDWGTSDTGLRWMYPAGSAGLTRANGTAVAALTSQRRFLESTVNVKVRDATVQYSFSFDRLPGGKGAKAIATVRKGPSGAYRAKVRVGGTGRVWLSFNKIRWGKPAPFMPRPLELRGWTYQPGQTVQVKVQILKLNPTQLRMKAWPQGSAEPARWQLVRNDTSDDVEPWGRVGLRAGLSRSAWRLPLKVRFDDFKVNRALDAEMAAQTVLPAPRKAAPKPAPKPAPTPAPTDTSKPKIEKLFATDVTANSAKVSWTLDVPATGQVRYGTTKQYGYFTKRESSFDYRTHVQRLTGLEPGTTYHYRIVSRDETGNRVMSADHTFVTAGLDEAEGPLPTPAPTATPTPEPPAQPKPTPVPTDEPTPVPTAEPTAQPTPEPTAKPTAEPGDTTSPAVLEVRVDDVAATSAVVTWSLDEYATGQVMYGPTPDLGTTTKKEESFNYKTHVQTLASLDPDTTYHFQVVSVDAAGNRVIDRGHTFTTLAPAPTATPVATQPGTGDYPATTTLTYAATPSSARPKYLVPVVDPTYGTTVTRVSDEVNVRQRYSSKSAWNADGSMLLLDFKNGSREVRDGTDFSVLQRNVGTGAYFAWSNKDPNVGYAGGGGATTDVRRYRITPNGEFSIANVSDMRVIAGWSEMSFGGGQGSPSNGDVMAVTFKKPNGDWGAAVLDLTSVPAKVVSERVFGNSSNTLGSLIDNVGMSQTGRWLSIAFTPDGTGTKQGVWLYKRDLATDSRVQVLTQEEHWDWARNAAGQDIFVYRAGSNDVAVPGTYGYNAETRREYVLVSGLSGNVHYSGRNISRPGWVYVASTTAGTRPGYGVVFAVNLDDPSRVQVFAHHHHTVDLGYASEIHPTASPDGRQVAFASEWGGSAVYAFVASQ